MTPLEQISSMVEDANPSRSMETLMRRHVKLLEEAGETSGAWLSLTQPGDYKKIVPADLFEELVDLAIIALDLAMTPETHEEAAVQAARVHGCLSDPPVFGRRRHDGVPFLVSSAARLAQSGIDACLGVRRWEGGELDRHRLELARLASMALRVPLADITHETFDPVAVASRKMVKWRTIIALREAALASASPAF